VNGQDWRVTVYVHPDELDGAVVMTAEFNAPDTDAARGWAELCARPWPYTLEPICPVCGEVIAIGQPLHLEPESDDMVAVYTHPRCTREAGQS